MKDAALTADERPPGLPIRVMVVDGRSSLVGQSNTMPELAEMLTTFMDRPVVDATGLKGKYDFTLTYLPDGVPDIFGAVEEQLGLRLDGKKAAVEMVVVDRGEKVPTGN